jgi:hypothetical protein
MKSFQWQHPAGQQYREESQIVKNPCFTEKEKVSTVTPEKTGSRGKLVSRFAGD